MLGDEAETIVVLSLEAVREGQARASLLSIRRLITAWIMAWLVSHNRS
jgi:hypothetical protein